MSGNAQHLRLDVKVVPGASRSEIVGWLGDVLKVKVAAPPEKGKANKALIQLFSDACGIAPSRIGLITGQGSARKVIQIDGITREQFDTFVVSISGQIEAKNNTKLRKDNKV